MQTILLSREEVARSAYICYGETAFDWIALLNEQELVIQFTEGGLVAIDEL